MLSDNHTKKEEESPLLGQVRTSWDQLGPVRTSWDQLGLVRNHRNYRILTLKKTSPEERKKEEEYRI